MSAFAKYVVLSSGKVNHIDLGFGFPDLSLGGKRIEYLGSDALDTVFLRPGVDLDFSFTGNSQDKVYLSGSWDDYKDSLTFPVAGNSTIMTLERTVDGKTEKVRFTRGFSVFASDNLVFSDGVINAHTISNERADAVPDPTHETSLNPDFSEIESASIKMTKLSLGDMTFAAVGEGMSQEVVGDDGVDTVYVRAGATVNALSLSLKNDIIYLQGNFSDYRKDVSTGGRIVFSRDHDSNPATDDERVTVAAGFGANNDILVFADGSVLSTSQLRSILAASGVDPNAVTTDQLGDLWDPATTTPGVSNDPFVVSFATTAEDGAYQTGDEIVITATMNKDVKANSTFDVTLDSGATVTLTADAAGTTLTGVYTVGAEDGSADLTVASIILGNVEDLEDNVMSSTRLPPASANIAANHDIVVNGLFLESVMNGVSQLDVRSSLVLNASDGEGLAFTRTPGEYKIRVIEQTVGDVKAGFGGEEEDGSQTITVIIGADGNVERITGGEVSFSEGKAVIDFGRDLDLANTFTLEAVDELFIGATSGAAYNMRGEIRFDTITPGTDGTAALKWDGAALSEGDLWFDGSYGDFEGNENGAVLDLSGHSSVVVIGRDTDESSSIVLDSTARTRLSGFGADDRIYIDQGIHDAVNTISEDTISFTVVNGAPTTVLLFSSREESAAVFIGFENNPHTPEEENTFVAAAFFDEGLPHNSVDKSFQEILNLQPGESPVISG